MKQKTLQKTLETIRKHNLIEDNMHIVIGLSGGPDSVCLFDILKTLSVEMNLTLHAVHVNHKFRPGAAEQDQQYVEQLCKDSGVESRSFVVDCNELAKREGLTSEEAGRKARYDAFSQVAGEIYEKLLAEELSKLSIANRQSTNFDKADLQTKTKSRIAIALAHNANDQCETILFRLMRGTGTDGLAGIPYKRLDENGFAIIRPIMDLKREEIEKYCEEANLSPRIDHTNDENIYARNKIRNLLIPFMEQNFNDGLIDTVNRLGKVAACDKDYLANEARAAYEDAAFGEVCSPNPALDCEALRELHKAIRFRVYTIALKKLGMIQNLTYAQGEAVDAVLNSNNPSAICHLSEGYVARRRYDKLVFDCRCLYKADGNKAYTQGDEAGINKEAGTNNEAGDCRDDAHSGEHRIPGSESRGWRILSLTPEAFGEYKKENAGKVYGAFAGVRAEELMVRTRKAGDRIKLSSGSKKIQDFFVDQKVPKVYRDEALLLAKGSHILWVLPSVYNKGRFSTEYRIDENENSKTQSEQDHEMQIVVVEKVV